MGGHQRTDGNGILFDICDAERYKTHPLYSTDPTALQIILYFDELEVCNPIGSNRKKHKLGTFSIHILTVIQCCTALYSS